MHSIVRCVVSLCVTATSLVAQAPPGAALGRAQQLIGANKFAEAVPVLDSVIGTNPANVRAWVMLGAARRGLGQTDSAAAALEHAATLPGGRGAAALPLFLLYAHAGRADSAFAWVEALRQSGRQDLSGIAARTDIQPLHGDARFAFLFPDKIAFEPPFVEPVRIIHEWRGEAAGDEFGWIARGIGDVDGDGVTDVVISATQNAPFGKTNGKVYVYSGKSGKLLWKHEGASGALLGIGLESAGDVNGDGIPDVIAGAPGIDAAFVYSGRDGRELLRLAGDSTNVRFGQAVSGIGDFNGDGKSDLIVSAPFASPHGAASGQAFIFSGADGKRLLTLSGDTVGEGFGSSVGGGGGKYFIVGATGGGPQQLGQVFIYDRLSATPRFVENADSTGIALGAMFVSVVGDVDGDGTPDVYASDFSNQAKGPATGRVYVYSGKTGAVLTTLTGDGPGQGFGIGAARAGDVDGDGHADLVLGAWQYHAAAWSGGRVSVLSGKDGHALMTITGKVPGETLGFDAVGVGDVDGDGSTDYLITSAWSLVNGARSGRVYIVSGESVRRKR